MRIKSMIKQVINDTPEFVQVGSMIDPEFPEGFVGVSGCFLDDEGTILITLVSKYEPDEDFQWKDQKANKFYCQELRKTFNHEMVHMKQLLRGESFDDMDNTDDKVYYSHPLEIEAYGRADMYIEVAENGYSETLGLYTELFGKGSEEVEKLIGFCEAECNVFKGGS